MPSACREADLGDDVTVISGISTEPKPRVEGKIWDAYLADRSSHCSPDSVFIAKVIELSYQIKKKKIKVLAGRKNEGFFLIFKKTSK